MNKRFTIKETKLPGLYTLKRTKIEDKRGSFARMFCDKELAGIMSDRSVVQINHTCTAEKSSVRGIHFQYPPFAEAKFVSCIRGRVFDVVVDLRRKSPTFLHWHGEVLSSENAMALFIPEGFAHGFQVMECNSELLYFHTSPYHMPSEGGLHPEDPKLAIQWPCPVINLSRRDAEQSFLDDSFTGLDL
ncbi:dTDP-4-dehydrorhamnose 3,5-epimerase family protein [Desulfobotulus sp. H1]|uniref:dTDP-4-dehydrorhamnose 3,5-epimerase n=1 Tax=Desulfobotulus pelophilus TaxID=2823377 RepID=A0ABT3NDT0_9BACT|nr:dTDP-4-dehydrorhamnose 3,5-epimerase family protein [Desulfobotulus pelophilus]MCW7755341.1 dTDP-4-dehydrorhamnose 3,5-epimerase family protein [Desulfobotulus pelophilus]